MTYRSVHDRTSGHLTHPKYRPDIDGLRAVAVLSVVGFHAFPSWVRGGFIGVDIFFVISGFLISTIIYSSLDRNAFSFVEFYGRRVRRIFPTLIVVLAFCFAFGWFTLLADEYKQLGKHIAGGAGFMSNFILLMEAGYFDNVSDTKPLLHLWSLGIEEQFYLVWPLLLWLAWKKRFNLLTITTTIAVVSFAYNVATYRSNAVAAFYSPQTRFWELLSGATLAYITLHSRKLLTPLKTRLDVWLGKIVYANPPEVGGTMLSDAQSIIGAFIIATGVLVITKERHLPGFWAVLPVLGTLLVIAAGERAWFNRAVLSNRLLVWFGLISFPLYLWHWSLISFIRIIESETPSVFFRTLTVMASILLAWLTYRFIERPVRFGENGRKKTIILMLLMIVLGCIGYNVYRQNGFGLRSTVVLYESNKIELIRTSNIDESCLSYINESNPTFYYCKFNNIGSNETVAVIGDSHAHAAFPGVSELFQEKGINTVLLANTGCPPFIGGEYGDNDDERQRCKINIGKIIELVSRKKDIKKVLIFSLGAINITGTAADGDYPNTRKLPFVPIPVEVFKSSLQKTIDILNNNGKSVYYVTENPEVGFDVKGCLARPLKTANRKCEVNKSDVIKRQKDYLDVVDSLRNARVIHTMDGFCKNNVCSVFKDGILLYVDNHHLSVFGSRWQAREILAPHFK